MQGAGVALLYLTIFAAFSTYELITLYPAIGLLLLISVASAALALRHESVALAIIGILGAFGAPFILGGFAQTSSDVVRAGPSIQLMTYVMVVDIGVLALSTFRNWRWLTLIALIGSLASFGSWHNEYGDSVSLLTSQGSLTIVFLIFVGATTLYHIIWRRAPEAFDHSLMVINAAAYFGISYGLLWDDFRPWMGGFTLLLSLFYGAIAYITWVRSREHVYLSLMALGIALVFLTIAVPVQLGGPWISVAWAVEGAVLMWLSFTLRMPQKRVFSVGVFAIFAAWLLILDTPEALSVSLTPFLNRYFPAYLVSIGATYLAAYLLRRNKDHLQEWETMWFPAFLAAANLFLTVMVTTQVDGVWVTITWAVEAVALMWLSFRLGIYELRLFSLGVFATMAVRLLAFDTPDALSTGSTDSLSIYLPAYLVSIGATYLAAYLLRRYKDDLQEWETMWVPAFIAAGSLFLTVMVPTQVDGVWTTVTWAIEAVALMWLSFRLGIYELRLFSLGVFATMAVRLLAFDTPVDLEDFRLILNLRMVAFGSGILALYLASYLTIRGRNALQEWEKVDLFRALPVGASFLTLWVSSAEVINAVDSGIVDVTGQTADSVKSQGLSLLWGVYASVVLVLGFVRGWRQVRVAGLGLLAVPILKLFLIDTFELERGYRVAAFLSLGGLLLVSGFLYQRYSGVIKGFLFEEEKPLSQS